MKIILLQDVAHVGRKNELKEVSNGYARNFLFPRKLARVADKNSAKEAGKMKTLREAHGLREKAQANATAEALKDVTIEITKKAGPKGTLFSSVSKTDIAKETSRITGFKFDADMIDLGEHGEHIKHLGEYLAMVNLDHDLKVELKVTIKS